MVNHQFGRLQRINSVRVATEIFHGITHGCKINDRRNAGKILHQYTRRAEGNFTIRLRLRIPVYQRIDIAPGDGFIVFMAQQIFKQDFERIRQTRNIMRFTQLAQAEYFK